MLSETSQSQEDGYDKIPLYEGRRAVEIIETESQMGVAGGWEGRRMGSYTLTRTEF